MILEHTNAASEAEQRLAARALLSNPLMTDRTHPDELVLVRRHTRGLTDTFTRLLGYQLIVEPTFARLVKAPPTTDTPPRGARRPNGTPFTPRTYTFLALSCAALLSAEIGEQVLISALVAQVRAEAQAAGIGFGENLEDRRHLVHALRWLIDHDILEETEGTVQAWADQDAEALVSVRRGVLPHLLARPVHTTDPAALLTDTDTDTGPDQPRRRLRRRLVDNPVAHRPEMSAGERDVLSRERTVLATTLADRFGLELEVRAEGAMAYDPAREVSDLEFPGPGTVKQAALLVLDVIIDTRRPHAGTRADLRGQQVPGLAVDDEEVRAMLEDLVAQYGRNWSEALTSDLRVLTDQVIAMLTDTGLAHHDQERGQLIVWPVVARYRPQPRQQRPHQPPAPATTDLFSEMP